MDSILVAVFDCLLVVETFESKHIKCFLHFFYLFFNGSLLSFKKLFSDEIAVYDKNGNVVTSGKIKTGYRARISDRIYEISVLGDITGEGNVKSNDVSALMSYFVEKTDLIGVYLASADYNNDGSITNKYLVGIARQAKN